jgi:hypothetical protein
MSAWENPMVKKMNNAEFVAWRTLYTKRLDFLRNEVIQTMSDANEGLMAADDAERIISNINEEVNTIIECGKLLNTLRKGN